MRSDLGIVFCIARVGWGRVSAHPRDLAQFARLHELVTLQNGVVHREKFVTRRVPRFPIWIVRRRREIGPQLSKVRGQQIVIGFGVIVQRLSQPGDKQFLGHLPQLAEGIPIILVSFGFAQRLGIHLPLLVGQKLKFRNLLLRHLLQPRLDFGDACGRAGRVGLQLCQFLRVPLQARHFAAQPQQFGRAGFRTGRLSDPI